MLLYLYLLLRYEDKKQYEKTKKGTYRAVVGILELYLVDNEL